MSVISPTVGRKVWFRPNGITGVSSKPWNFIDHLQPMDATVTYVWGDRRVNLLIADHYGHTHSVPSVTLFQEGDATPASMFCEWMPYQMSAAKKADAPEPRAVEPMQTKFLDFGAALHHLKQGRLVARAGWNGKGMFIYLNGGSCDWNANPLGAGELIGGVPSSLFNSSDKGTITRMPNLNMRAADGVIVTGWLASQTDMLSSDWELLE